MFFSPIYWHNPSFFFNGKVFPTFFLTGHVPKNTRKNSVAVTANCTSPLGFQPSSDQFHLQRPVLTDHGFNLQHTFWGRKIKPKLDGIFILLHCSHLQVMLTYNFIVNKHVRRSLDLVVIRPNIYFHIENYLLQLTVDAPLFSHPFISLLTVLLCNFV